MQSSTEAAELDGTRAEQINAWHTRGCESASETVVCGLQAGRLLCEAKAELPHGAFRRWAEAQLECSATAISRYMKAWSGFQRSYPELASQIQTKCPARSFYPNSDTAALRALPSLRELAGDRPKRRQPRPDPEPPRPAPPGQEGTTEPEIPLRLPADCPVPKDAVKPKVGDSIRMGRAVLESIMRDINAICRRLENTATQTDWLAFGEVQSMTIGLQNVRREIRAAAPHGPCVHCNQRGCKVCKPIGVERGLGWLPRNRYEMSPEKLKAL